MAKKSDKKSGFSGPAIGKTMPKGTTVKKNKDGTVTLVQPKKSKSK